MSGSAWAPGSTVTANSANTVIPERQTATQGQTLITLGLFTYTPNTNSLIVMVNGVVQDSGVDYTETSASSLTFSSGLTAGDRVTILGLTAITGTSPALTLVRPSGSIFANGFSAAPVAVGAGLLADFGNVAAQGRIAAFNWNTAVYNPLTIDANVLKLNTLSGSPITTGAGLVTIGGAISVSGVLGVTGLATFNAGQVVQGYTVSPGAATYMESGVTGGNGNINVINRTGTIFAPLVLNSTLTITNGTGIATTGLISAASGTATVAGGSATGLLIGSANIAIVIGSGVPTIAAARGSLYIRTDNGANTSLYINRDGGTTWAAVTSA